MEDRVKEACEACFEAHASDCSGFARAVSDHLGVQLHGLATIRVGPAAPAFGAVVVLTMMATRAFDPRLIWDVPGDEGQA